MLRNCLESIALQSRKDYIKEVIVSENSSDTQSFDLAKSFSGQLPIRYIKQDNGLSPQEHGMRLSCEAKTKYVALLADDDMWARYHLEEAYRCFHEHPSIHAYFGQPAVVSNESCFPVARFSGSFLQVPHDNNRTLKDFLVWDRKDAAVHCFANTPLNIWSLVALTDSFTAALHTSLGDPIYGKYPSSDRLLIWRISLHGDIGVGRNISLFYRRHPQSDVQTCLRQDLIKTQEEDFLISMEIARQAIELDIDIFLAWAKEFGRAQSFGLADQIDITPQLKEFMQSNYPLEIALPRILSVDKPLPSWRAKINNLRYLLTPPALEMLLTKLHKT
jgi:hypothetical protein